MNLKRFLGNIAKSYLAIGALSVSAFAGADEYSNQNWGGACCPTQCCPTQCCTPPCCEPPCCAWGYNPPAYLRCGTNCCESFMDGLGFEVDFLWWRPSTDCLDLGSEELVVFSPSTALGTETFNGSKIKKPKFKYDPGFKLGLNHNCDCWDVALNWTHFHSKAKASGASSNIPTTGFVGTGPFTVFVPFWERTNDAFPDVAHSHWTFDVDLVDLEFGHKYFVSNCFSMRPHVGLRGGRVDQGLHIESFADRPATSEFGDFNDFESFVHAKNNLHAIGPRVGVDLELNLGCGFAIVGRGAATVLFGKTERHARENFTAFTTVGSVTTEDEFEYHVNGSNNRVSRTMTDLAIGLEWDHCFCWCNHYHPVSFAILWEHHAFYDFNDFNFGSAGFDIDDVGSSDPIRSSHRNCSSNDIFTQGLTVALNVGF